MVSSHLLCAIHTARVRSGGGWLYYLCWLPGAGPAPHGPGAGLAGLGFGLGQAKAQPFSFSKEYYHLMLAAPDLAAIRAAHVAAVILVGALSTGAYYARTVPLIARQLGCTWDTVPGNHLAFLLEPEPFAKALSEVIARFPSAQLALEPADVA